jgi:hypothetical protein
MIFSTFHNVFNPHSSRRPSKVLFRAHFMWLARIAVVILCKFEYYIKHRNKSLQKSQNLKRHGLRSIHTPITMSCPSEIVLMESECMSLRCQYVFSQEL